MSSGMSIPSNPEFDELIIKLKIIGKIKENGSIRTQDNQISIDDTSWYQSLSRYYYGESRNNAIETLKNIITKSEEYVSLYLESSIFNLYFLNNDPSEKEKEENSNMCTKLKSLSNELQSAKKGIINLSKTYINDAITLSQLEIIETHISQLIQEIEKRLEKMSEKRG